MGVAPEAILESFSSIGSSKLFSLHLCIVALFLRNDFVGCAPRLPMVVAPEAIVEIFSGIDSKISVPSLLPGITCQIFVGCFDQHR
jgi:hypothetical protein